MTNIDRIAMEHALEDLGDVLKECTRAEFKTILFLKAYEELERSVKEGYYNSVADLEATNYSEICEWLKWPDLQDGGIFEQIIDAAVKAIIAVYFT